MMFKTKLSTDLSIICKEMNKMNKNDKLTVNYMRINSYDMRVQFYTNMIAETWSKYFNKNAIHLHQLKPNEVRAFEPLLIKHSVNYDHFYQRLPQDKQQLCDLINWCVQQKYGKKHAFKEAFLTWHAKHKDKVEREKREAEEALTKQTISAWLAYERLDEERNEEL